MAAAVVPVLSGRHVAVAGAGAIGSFLLSHMARTPGLETVTLIDPDVCEERNLQAQNICAADVGKPKVIAHAARLRRINPALTVESLRQPIEAVPVGRLAVAAIASCVDNRRARQYINEFAWRLGVPLVDAAVDADSSLVRVNCYVPGPKEPCAECAWDEADYALLEQAYPCQGEPVTPPTNAPSQLAALAASLQAGEIRKILAGHRDAALIGRQVLIDAHHHAHHVSRFARNEHCRFDHETWVIRRLACDPDDLTLEDAFALVPPEPAGDRVSLAVPGQAFVRRLGCTGCGWQSRRVLYLANRLPSRRRACPGCGGQLMAVGFDRFDELDSQCLTRAARLRTLRSVGFQRGDILSLTAGSGETHHFEISGVAP